MSPPTRFCFMVWGESKRMRGASLVIGGIVLGLISGFVLGGVRPRLETQDLREQLARANQELKGGRRSSGGSRFLPIPGFGDFGQQATPKVSGSKSAGRDAEDRPRRRWWSPPPPTEGTQSPAIPPRRVSENRGAAEPDRGQSAERREGFEAAISLQKLRAQQSRAALKEKAQLSDEQLARVDEVVLKMNQELSPYADQLMQLASATEEPQPLELLFVSQEVSSIMYKGQSEFEATVGAEPLEKVDAPSKQVWNYVDLEMFKGAAESLRARREAGDAGAPLPSAPTTTPSAPAP